MEHSVYWIRHADHTDIFRDGYVGISKDATRRFSEHRRGVSSNNHLKHAIKKYGVESVVFEIVLVSDMNYCLDIERKLRPENGIGWNLVVGGGKPPVLSGYRPALRGRTPWNKGKKMSDATRDKVSKAVKKQMADPEHRKLLSAIKVGKQSPRAGATLSQETKQKMSLSRLGKPSKKKGIKLTGAVLENTINAAKTKWVCPHCNLSGMGRGAANRWHFDNCKHKDLA